jgi:hypothetical protein
MGTYADRLIALSQQRSTERDDPELDLDALRTRAADERLQEQRAVIPVLDQRAREVGIDSVKSRDDLVPLLFAHSNYKSYPDSFIAKGQWNRLSMWLNTVAAADVMAVDMDGVRDIDEWADRLAEAGIYLWASSGTTGKASFIPVNEHDMELNRSLSASLTRQWPGPMPVSVLAPAQAPMKFAHAFKATAEAIALPGQISYLSANRMRLADSMRSAAMRNAMANGTATPADIAAYRAETARAAAERDAEVRAMATRIFSLRDRPQLLYGFWAPAWRILEIGREQGIADGSFHPDTVVSLSGGLKGLDLPDDYAEQVSRFFGSTRAVSGYGMTELAFAFRMCRAGRYHPAPALTLLMLDETGEHLLEPGEDGKVSGRVGIYDVGHEGHWGGIVTGDHAVADFSATCPCGSPGPVLENSIVRYTELSAGGDDKLTCGGTINEYIRGALGG